MVDQQTCFTTFSDSIKSYSLPQRFTFPFCYEPHPLCLLAAEELQQQLENHHAFKLELKNTGKMFGVLLVENIHGEIGYLSAFSGQFNVRNKAGESPISFVPPVFKLDDETDFFQKENRIINKLNQQLDNLLSNPEIAQYQLTLESLIKQQNKQIEKQYAVMAVNRKIRKKKRCEIKEQCTGDELAQKLKVMAKESVNDKNQLRDIKQSWLLQIEKIQNKLFALTHEIDDIKKLRKRLSTKLQKKLFKQYRMLNSAGIEKDLIELFQEAPYPIPPAGTGDCAAPKLLQYAFAQKLKPLAMAEFWWGKSPKSEIRQHKNFYGACSGKCQPILTHMLDGMELDDNPLLVNPAEGRSLEIIYHDNDIVVVNKPSEFLSVPGKNIEDSVYLRIKQQFPEATGNLIVHRLDMSTSGVMVLALTKRAQKNLQQQFVNRTIKKCYVAILEGNIVEKLNKQQGDINLPLRGDLDDRPRQLVCFNHGKPSKTNWEVIETHRGKSKLYLYPESGRTHQLRVHCAHPKGLNMPILGDDLYGNITRKEAQRLHLHAQRLTLSHPVTKEVMTFEVEADF